MNNNPSMVTLGYIIKAIVMMFSIEKLLKGIVIILYNNEYQ